MQTNKQRKSNQKSNYHREFRLSKVSSSTPGYTKGEHCQASSMDRYFCNRNRSYRHQAYAAWSKKNGGRLHKV